MLRAKLAPQVLFGRPDKYSQEDSTGEGRIIRKEGRSVTLDKMGDFAAEA